MIRSFTERYFLTDYSYILENHFYFVNAPAYSFKLSLSRIFCVNSSVKVFCTSSFYTFIIYRKKEIVFVVKFFPKYFFGPKLIPNYISSQVPRSRNQVKLSINKIKVVGRFEVRETKTLNFSKTCTW